MKTPLRRLWPAMLVLLVASCTERAPAGAESAAPVARGRAGRGARGRAGRPAGHRRRAAQFRRAGRGLRARGGQREHGRRRPRGPRRATGNLAGRPALRFLPRFRLRRARRPAAAGARRGLGFRHQRRRLHPDQRPRGRRRARGHGAHDGPTRVSRQGRRHRRAHRRRGAQDRGEEPAGRFAWATRRSLKAGEWVVAIGSPFGFENSVTAGIVSATARSLADAYTPFIQTDVAVNPGNSGGPLFNLQGEVVGINSQIYSRTGGYQGVSFAIPIDVAINVKDQLVANGRVERGRIGVTIQQVNQALADSFRLPRPRGALVSQVEARRSRRRGRPEAGRRDPRGGRQRRSSSRARCRRSSRRSSRASRRRSPSGATSPSARCASRSASSRTSPSSRCATRRRTAERASSDSPCAR